MFLSIAAYMLHELFGVCMMCFGRWPDLACWFANLSSLAEQYIRPKSRLREYSVRLQSTTTVYCREISALLGPSATSDAVTESGSMSVEMHSKTAYGKSFLNSPSSPAVTSINTTTLDVTCHPESL